MGRTVLHHLKLTPQKWVAKTARLLLEAGCDPRIRDFGGATPADWLVGTRNRDHAVASLMLDVAVQHWNAREQRELQQLSDPLATTDGTDALMSALDRVFNAWHNSASVDNTAAASPSSPATPTTSSRRPIFSPQPSSLRDCGAADDSGISDLTSTVRSLALSPAPSSSATTLPTPSRGDPASDTLCMAQSSSSSGSFDSPVRSGTIISHPSISRIGASAATPARSSSSGGGGLSAHSPLRPSHMTSGLASSPLAPRAWAWYAVLLVDECPPTMHAGGSSPLSDSSSCLDGTMDGRRPPIITPRRIAVLESSSIEPRAQLKSIALSGDPVSGYVVGAAVGPFLYGESPSNAEVACKRVSDAWRREMRLAFEERRCDAHCDAAAAADTAAARSDTSADAAAARVSSTSRDEADAAKVRCPQRQSQLRGWCEFSAYAALLCVLSNKDALLAGTSISGSDATMASPLRSRGRSAHRLPPLADELLRSFLSLPVNSVVHVIQPFLTKPRSDPKAPTERLNPLAEAKAEKGAGEGEA